jgi:hypothetical protein
LAAGNKPSVYRGKQFAPLKGGKPNCYFGPRTATAVVKLKRALGYPDHLLTPRADRHLVEILTGKRARPVGYVARAARRQAALVKARNPIAGTYAERVIQLARRELGCEEWGGTNNSTCVRRYQYYTGAYYAPWCVSFTQAIYSWAGVGTFANRSAGVFYVVGYARQRGWLRSQPKPGYLVAFMDRLGHIGIVERVTSSGFYSIEGNASNRVLRRWHPFSNHRPKVYIAVPGIDRRLPRDRPVR